MGEMRGSTVLKYIIVVFSLLAIVVPSNGVSAAASVGVGTGKIEVKSPIEVGVSMKLDSIAVYNDGDKSGNFEMAVMFNETQPEFKPKLEWITFSPANFNLQPGESQIVEVTITLPEYADSGKYFAYLEAHLMKDTTADGGTSTTISAAAAAKLSFTTSLPKSEEKTKDITSIFEQSNKDYMALNVTINKLLSVSTIL